VGNARELKDVKLRKYEALPVVCSVDSIAFLSLGSTSKLRLVTRGVLHYHLAAVVDHPNSSAEDSVAKPMGDSM
jgi:hypothetical protein